MGRMRTERGRALGRTGASRLRSALAAIVVVATLALLAMPAAAQQAIRPALGIGPGLDLPANWSELQGLGPDTAFRARGGSMATGFYRRAGTPAGDFPYAGLEETHPDIDISRAAGRREVAEQVAEFYRTAVNPPSKAARPSSWRRATVTPVQYDTNSERFTFDATITYDPPLGEVHLRIAGIFDRERLVVLGCWSDVAFDEAHPGEVASLRDSLRLVNGAGQPVRSPAASVKRFAQVVAALLVLAVVVLQVVVIVRERRARRGEAAELF